MSREDTISSIISKVNIRVQNQSIMLEAFESKRMSFEDKSLCLGQNGSPPTINNKKKLTNKLIKDIAFLIYINNSIVESLKGNDIYSSLCYIIKGIIYNDKNNLSDQSHFLEIIHRDNDTPSEKSYFADLLYDANSILDRREQVYFSFWMESESSIEGPDKTYIDIIVDRNKYIEFIDGNLAEIYSLYNTILLSTDSSSFPEAGFSEYINALKDSLTDDKYFTKKYFDEFKLCCQVIAGAIISLRDEFSTVCPGVEFNNNWSASNKLQLSNIKKNNKKKNKKNKNDKKKISNKENLECIESENSFADEPEASAVELTDSIEPFNVKDLEEQLKQLNESRRQSKIEGQERRRALLLQSRQSKIRKDNARADAEDSKHKDRVLFLQAQRNDSAQQGFISVKTNSPQHVIDLKSINYRVEEDLISLFESDRINFYDLETLINKLGGKVKQDGSSHCKIMFKNKDGGEFSVGVVVRPHKGATDGLNVSGINLSGVRDALRKVLPQDFESSSKTESTYKIGAAKPC